MSMSIDAIHAALTAPGQMFELCEETVRGAPLRVWKNAPPNLPALLEQSRAFGDRSFLVYEQERLSFATHYRQAATLAHRLIERFGVRKGDRIAIAMRNLPEWSVAFWGAAAAGAVVVPLNSWGTGDELAYGITDSGATLVIADEQRAARIRDREAGLALNAVLVVRAEPSSLRGVEVAFEDVLGEVADDIGLPSIDIAAEDPATIFYTSGTTGEPKGALGTQRNICGNVMSLAFARVRDTLRAGEALPDPNEPRPQQAYLLSVPFFHVTGCHGVLIGMLAFGGKIVLMHKWDAEQALELIEKEGITTFGGVPTMVWQVLDSASLAGRDVSGISSIAYGGAPAAPELLRRIEEAFPNAVASNGYGLTETSSLVTLNTGADYRARPLSAGAPLPVCEIQIFGEDGRVLPPGEVGEVRIRGANVVAEYWNRPEATERAFTDGWFHTGDLGCFDDEGFLSIVDRLKDIVIRGGENVYCAEVENRLVEHPAVLEAAVIGIPHPALGEEVAAVVSVRPGSETSEADLQSHVREQLAAFKVPSRIWIETEALPRNAAGKVLKRELREARLAESKS